MSHCVMDLVKLGPPETGPGTVNIPMIHLVTGRQVAVAQGITEAEARTDIERLCYQNHWVVTKDERPRMTWEEYIQKPEEYRGIKNGMPYLLYLSDVGGTTYGPVDIIGLAPRLFEDYAEDYAI